MSSRRAKIAYLQKHPRLVAPAKRKRYIAPLCEAPWEDLPVEMITMIVPPRTPREEFLNAVSNQKYVEWQNQRQQWVFYPSGQQVKRLSRGEGRHLLRNVLRWREYFLQSHYETWAPRRVGLSAQNYIMYSDSHELSGAPQIWRHQPGIIDISSKQLASVSALDELIFRGTVVQQDFSRPYMWSIKTPAVEHIIAYVAPRQMESYLRSKGMRKTRTATGRLKYIY